MTESNLITDRVPVDKHGGPRKSPVDRITPHCTAGLTTARALGNFFKTNGRNASSNYGIGNDGSVGLYVAENLRSWCSSNRKNDDRSITIECSSDNVAPYRMNDVVINKLVDLCTDICVRYGKTRLLWLADKTITEKYTPKENEMVLTVHRWYENKSCPGDYLYGKLAWLAEEVTVRLMRGEADATVLAHGIKRVVYKPKDTADRKKIIDAAKTKDINLVVTSEKYLQFGAYKKDTYATKCVDHIFTQLGIACEII